MDNNQIWTDVFGVLAEQVRVDVEPEVWYTITMKFKVAEGGRVWVNDLTLARDEFADALGYVDVGLGLPEDFGGSEDYA